jgi:hypothetical protein
VIDWTLLFDGLPRSLIRLIIMPGIELLLYVEIQADHAEVEVRLLFVLRVSMSGQSVLSVAGRHSVEEQCWNQQ